ncbi:MAG: preprotein translocase subunit SecA [Candidatus Omnitrophica bacterium]|nr:preprotein translocase subunit SecA [Candidatus Omnitrophota bacterium]
MISFLLRKLFGSQNERFLRRLSPVVNQINAFEEKMVALSDDALKAKTEEFRRRLSSGETIDDLLPEAFAVVREAARRTVAMRHFDVQLIGGVVLHRGMIAEMATGEGKTLVATLPAYLNALGGKGVHIVTVNDYLARRDREWMGPIYEFLGLSVGVIQHDLGRLERQAAYACDITYGTNNEFGFDYLRDNMVMRPDDIVQRDLHYAIVDEVDSILIDEARTPLIISGVVERSNETFMQLRAPVENLVKRQRRIVNDILDEAIRLYRENPDDATAYFRLLQAETGDPKNPRLLNFIAQYPEAKKKMNKLLGELMVEAKVEKKESTLREGLLYATDERRKSLELTDLGIRQLEQSAGNIFDLNQELLEKTESFFKKDTRHATEAAKEGEDPLMDEYIEKSEKQHVVLQLLKAYVFFQKDTDYVVQPDGEVVIVDEFTGRLMPGRRWSDGLHQAVEAKEGTAVERASQTLATVTFQNYFRMYKKLSGMTGTAATEAGEFSHIYKLEVVTIPTNRPLIRMNLDDVIYKTEKEKFRAVCDEIEELYKKGRPVLVGTVSIEKSERLARMLERRGVPHQVLNAKHHEKEAHIVAQAGRLGAVTIATNMAGRGTDILLGGNPESLAQDIIANKRREGHDVSDTEMESIRAEMKQKTAQGHATVVELGGLHVIGTERHEARRVDNQLRGRTGRQGDPGSSRFYLSLEDDLMRIFGSDRIASIMDRLGIEEGQEIQNPLVTRAIGTAQKRVESYNFEIRKHLLDYDNVMNAQREVIYAQRRQILMQEQLEEYVREICEGVLSRGLSRFVNPDVHYDEWDLSGLARWLAGQFGLRIDLKGELEKMNTRVPDAETVRELVLPKTEAFYAFKTQALTPQRMRDLERFVLLEVIEEEWKEHLHMLDSLQEGIGLRAIGQRDPLVEYKNEAFALFMDMIDRIEERAVKMLFRLEAVSREAPEGILEQAPVQFVHPELGSFRAPAGGTRSSPEAAATPSHPDTQPSTYRRTSRKVGRNEPCPCGSGKKYKKCCGQ